MQHFRSATLPGSRCNAIASYILRPKLRCHVQLFFTASWAVKSFFVLWFCCTTVTPIASISVALLTEAVIHTYPVWVSNCLSCTVQRYVWNYYCMYVASRVIQFLLRMTTKSCQLINRCTDTLSSTARLHRRLLAYGPPNLGSRKVFT